MSVKNVLGQNVYLSFNELTPLSVEHIDLSNIKVVFIFRRYQIRNKIL